MGRERQSSPPNECIGQAESTHEALLEGELREMSCFFRFFDRRSAAGHVLICITLGAMGCASACIAAAQSTAATFELPAAPHAWTNLITGREKIPMSNEDAIRPFGATCQQKGSLAFGGASPSPRPRPAAGGLCRK